MKIRPVIDETEMSGTGTDALRSIELIILGADKDFLTQYNNGYGYGNTGTNGVFDGVGDAAGEGTFSMNFSGRGNTNMRGYGNGSGYGDGWGRGYN